MLTQYSLRRVRRHVTDLRAAFRCSVSSSFEHDAPGKKKKKTTESQTHLLSVENEKNENGFVLLLTFFWYVVFTMNSTNQIPFTPVLPQRWIWQIVNE